MLSRQLRAGDEEEAASSLNRAMEFALLMTIPAAAALMIIPYPVIAVLFERGAFGSPETGATAAALAAYALGLPAYVLIKVLGPGFFAREDTVTPVKIAAGCVVINLVLNLLLMGPFVHVGIALATAISAWINAGLLMFVLRRRGHFRSDLRLRKAIPRGLLASAAMAAAIRFSMDGLAGYAAADSVQRTIALAVVIAIGLAAFAAAALLFGAARREDIKRMLDRSAR
jgi:putative peptidoglycan lipid II flippase